MPAPEQPLTNADASVWPTYIEALEGVPHLSIARRCRCKVEPISEGAGNVVAIRQRYRIVIEDQDRFVAFCMGVVNAGGTVRVVRD